MDPPQLWAAPFPQASTTEDKLKNESLSIKTACCFDSKKRGKNPANLARYPLDQLADILSQPTPTPIQVPVDCSTTPKGTGPGEGGGDFQTKGTESES